MAADAGNVQPGAEGELEDQRTLTELLTFLVTDVEGSTLLWERHPADMFDAMARHDAIVAQVLASSGGRMIGERGEGDSTFSVFHDPVSAVEAAADLARSYAAGPWPADLPLRVRIAVYTGEVKPRDGRYYGTTPNRAARLRSLAYGGQILIGPGTAELVRDHLPPRSGLVDLGPRMLKDLSRAEQVFELRLEEFALPEDAIDDAGASNLAWLQFTASDSFVGRTEELQTMTEAWELAASGRRVLALVHGEPGIGKTTLAAELARRVHDEGGLVMYGRWDQEALAPYQALREALGEYARACPRSILRADLREQASELARIVPELAERIEGLKPPGRASAEAERHRLFEALDGWIAAIASRRSVLLVLDDLHWADRASLLLVRHVVRKQRPSRLLLVCAYRETDLEGTELAAFLPEFNRADVVRRVSLGGLGGSDVAELIGRLTATHIERDQFHLAEELRQETAGNPFFLREIVTHLDDVGALTGGGAGQAVGSLDIPDTVRDVVRWRLARLSAGSGEALAVAATIGHEFAPVVLAGASGFEEEQLLDLLDEGAHAGLIGETPEPESRYAFSHEVVRRVLLDGLSAARRARLHRRIGEVLEGLGERFATPAELAHHFHEAAPTGVSDKAVQYARLAGDRAREAVAFEAAAEHYRTALEDLDRYGPEDPALRCELLLAIGAVHDMIGEFASRDQRFLEAAEGARRLDRADLFAQAVLGYGGAWLPAAIRPNPTAQALLEESLALLDEEDGVLRARVTARLAHWLHYAKPYEERRLLADQALAMGRRVGDPATLATVIFDRCWALDGPDEVEEDLALADEVLRLAGDVGVMEVSIQGMRIRLGALFERGDYDAARAAGSEFGRVARELRHPEAIRLASLWEVVEASVAGRLEDADRLAAEGFARLQEMGHPQAQLVLVGQTFAWRWLQGRADEYLPIFEGLRQAEPGSLPWSSSVAWIAAETGDLESARRVLDSITPTGAAAMDRNYTWWGNIVGFAHAASALGDEEWASALVDLARPYAGHNCTLGLLSFNGAVAHHLGVLLGVMTRWDEAVHYLETALQRHEAMGARPYTALTQQALATALHRRNDPGDRRRAEETGEVALATAEDLGLRAVRSRASLAGWA
jgi:class 3 adenylate cyclase/tetratricopeptide (TPR) repeat protein